MGKYVKRISVQLNPEVSVRLNRWCLAHDRNLTWAINHLAGKALDAEGWPSADSLIVDELRARPAGGPRTSFADNPTGMEP